MTDHNSPAGGNGGNQPPVQPGQFGPPNTAAGQQQPAPQGQQPQPPQQAQQQVPPQAPGPYGYPAAPAAQGPAAAQQPMASEAARAQVAAAWTRRAPQAVVPPGEAAVPALPPRQSPAPGAAGPSKKDRREQAKAERKAAYEAKKAQRESRKRGGAPAATPSAMPVGTSSYAPGGTATPAATPAGAPARTPAGASFDVPAPGGRLPATGRNTHVALRATLLFTTCAFALGSCGVVGLAIGKSSDAPTAALDKKDVQKYRLTEFPTRSAATFAEKYATLCLTYDEKTADQRRDELARYATSGVDRDCGWNGQGTQSVTGAAWDGSVEDLPEYGKNGRYLGVQVTLSSGRVTTVSVPVYVANPAAGSGLRVVGDVGEMPLPGRGTAPEVDREGELVDDTLSEQLKERVLGGYFIAWGASDSTSMSRFTTPDATVAATSGLAGALSVPQVEKVEALAPAGTEDGDTITYKYGQSVPVRVTVVWGGARVEGATGEAATTQIKRSYRLTVVNTAQGWFVKDVRGAVLDPAGGSGDGGEPGASPSPGQATPSAGTTTPPATGATQPPATKPATKPTTKPTTKPPTKPGKS
ncbi:conjugal transfer protein [Streptomyces sp. P9(2023)]|uniref:conjugal transfer protein n=1 Tax=Streptomyces sp. P9(2023) TaxID=3064394 RepID=UPI0028F3FC3C|nr:conjugal transfer protein [Streptomyces sp. P9(2023)]MDT9688406.1 conjugal transfer protein [Streptomyces sp. P9(2023)]